MAAPEHHETKEGYFVAQTYQVERRPNEPVAILTRMEFQVLKDGEISGEAKANRDMSLGICVTAAIGLIGVLATVNWEAPLRQVAVFICTLVLGVVLVASASLAIIQHLSYRRRRSPSAYSALMNRLTNDFLPRGSSQTEATETVLPNLDREP
jgi:hypothetical protein